MKIQALNSNNNNKVSFGLRAGDDETERFFINALETAKNEHIQEKDWVNGKNDRHLIAKDAIRKISNLIDKESGNEPFLFVSKDKHGYKFALEDKKDVNPYNSRNYNQIRVSTDSTTSEILTQLANELSKAKYGLTTKTPARISAERAVRKFLG